MVVIVVDGAVALPISHFLNNIYIPYYGRLYVLFFTSPYECCILFIICTFLLFHLIYIFIYLYFLYFSFAFFLL